MSLPSNALTSVYLSLPAWDVDQREYTIGIHAKEDDRLLATETHKFRFKAFELAMATARRLEGSIDSRPALTPEEAAS